MPAASRYVTPMALPMIDVRSLKRNGLLAPGTRAVVTKRRAGRIVCEAIVRVRECGSEVLISANGRTEAVELVRTAQWFGGSRAWFSCPECLRRAAILYPFSCRRCSGVAYPSQREAPHHRAIRRAQHHRIRLGGSANLTEPLPPRPWGMWDRTYRQRIEACRKADARSLAASSAVLQRWFDGSRQPSR